MASATRVLNLLLQARQAGPIDRARSVASALKEFSQLGSDQKRNLAVLVAQRAAPQLVPKIESETGLDLSLEQIRTVVDLVGQLGTDNLEELRDAVETVEASNQPITQATPPAPTDASDASAAAEAADPDPEAAATVAAAAAAARQRLQQEQEAAEAEARRAIAEAKAEAARARRVINLAREGDAPLPEADDEPVIAEPDPPAELPAAISPLPESVDDEPMDDPGQDDPDEDDPDENDLEPARPQAAGDEDGSLPPDVLAAPDGWRRRRALLMLIHNDDLPAAAATAAVASLARPTDRVWIAASLIETGEVELDELAPLLDQRAVRRLRRRYA